jgi:hypothetical protein
MNNFHFFSLFSAGKIHNSYILRRILNPMQDENLPLFSLKQDARGNKAPIVFSYLVCF